MKEILKIVGIVFASMGIAFCTMAILAFGFTLMFGLGEQPIKVLSGLCILSFGMSAVSHMFSGFLK